MKPVSEVSFSLNLRPNKTSVSQHYKGRRAHLQSRREDALGTHKSLRKIEPITEITRSSVVMLSDVLADHITASLHEQHGRRTLRHTYNI